MKVLLFDIDGTLLFTGGAGRIAFEETFEEFFGVPKAWGHLSPDGKTDPAIIAELSMTALGRELTGEEYQKVCRRYLEHFRRLMADPPQFRLVAGVRPLLEQLAKGPWLLGLATGNFEEAAWLKVEYAGLRSFFKFGGFGSDSIDRVELTRQAMKRAQGAAGRTIPPEDFVLVGDTPRDVAVGRELGMHTIGMATKPEREEALRRSGPDYWMRDFSHPEKFLEILESGFNA